jgi:hypothetical protein
VAWQFLEVPVLVKRLGRVIDAVQNDGDESERPTSLVTVAQCLGKEEPPESLALTIRTHAQPREHGDRQLPPRQVLGKLRRQVAEVRLSGRQRLLPHDGSHLVPEDLSHRESLYLVLEGLGCQPVVDLLLSGSERSAGMRAAQGFEAKPIGKQDAGHARPCMIDPNRRWAAVSRGVLASAFQNATCSSAVIAMV